MYRKNAKTYMEGNPNNKFVGPNRKYYTGVVSTEIPDDHLSLFRSVAKYLARQGYTLRSGANSAFEAGCDDVEGDKEIYIPCKEFSNSESQLYDVDDKAYAFAMKFNPAFINCDELNKDIAAREVYQIIGSDFVTFSDFIICWGAPGSETNEVIQAMRMAKHYGIKIFNSGSYTDVRKARVALFEFLTDIKM